MAFHLGLAASRRKDFLVFSQSYLIKILEKKRKEKQYVNLSKPAERNISFLYSSFLISYFLFIVLLESTTRLQAAGGAQ